MQINEEYIKCYVKSWEERHDEWVDTFLADAISSKETTFNGIKNDLKKFITTDWRGGFAFFADRTSYQGGVRNDKTNCKIATYFFKKIIKLPETFSKEAIIELKQTISHEKEKNFQCHGTFSFL